jgi:hypothetical protein
VWMLRKCICHRDLLGVSFSKAFAIPSGLLARSLLVVRSQRRSRTALALRLSATRFSAPPVFWRKRAPVEMTLRTTGASPLYPVLIYSSSSLPSSSFFSLRRNQGCLVSITSSRSVTPPERMYFINSAASTSGRGVSSNAGMIYNWPETL